MIYKFVNNLTTQRQIIFRDYFLNINLHLSIKFEKE